MPSSLSSTAWRWLCAALLTLVLFANSSLAGSTRYVWSHLAGSLGGVGSVDGAGAETRFDHPYGVARDGSGNVYVADTYNHTIRKIAPAGITTTLAGLAGVKGSNDGTGTEARFRFPAALAVDGAGNVYVADTNNHTIRKISPIGVTTTLAGRSGASGSIDGTGSSARFAEPRGVAVDASGNVYVADSGNHTIRRVSAAGETETIAGIANVPGSTDGAGAEARFGYPQGVAVDSAGTVFVADTNNHTIRKISPGGVVSTFAGLAGASGKADGTGSVARFDSPRGVAVDRNGSVYIADKNNQVIRKISSSGITITIAGTAGKFAFADGIGSAARFYTPTSVAVDENLNVYVADCFNSTVRLISPEGVVTTPAGVGPESGANDGAGVNARFRDPTGVAVDSVGNIFVADTVNHTIRKISPQGMVTTLAGLAGTSGSTEGSGSAARFWGPKAVDVDAEGNVYVGDSYNFKIRKISIDGMSSTLAGSGQYGTVDGPGSTASFYSISGLAVDSSGSVYIADEHRHTIRKVTSSGYTTTLAGADGVAGSADGQGSAARFYVPSDVAVDSAGFVYVADRYNRTIRKISPDGATTTLAGQAGQWGNSDGRGSSARFVDLRMLTVGTNGNIYVIDTGSSGILFRQISPDGNTTTLRVITPPSLPKAEYANSITVDRLGNLYHNDVVNHAIRKLILRGTRADFLGSAGTDLVWQNTTTGQRGLWIMDGVSFMSWVDLGTVPIAWRIAGTADFNGDGSPDIVWENTSTGERGAWLMNNTAFSSWFSLGTVPTAWRIAQVGASDAGDKTYLLWENTSSGERYIWTYTGTTFTSSTFLGVVPTDWKMVGFGDLNADTYNDLVWENTTTGERGVWFLNSSLSYTGWQSLGVIPTEWHIAGLADYNADDKLDLLWENISTGQRLVWHLDGTSYSSTGLIGSAPAEWRVTN